MFVYKLIYLCFIFNFCKTVYGDDLKDEILDSKAHSDRGGLWFGPRLGKRSMREGNSDKNRQLLLKLLEAADALKYYYDQLPYDLTEEDKATPEDHPRRPLPVFTPLLGRSVNDLNNKRTSENMDFTPRLGRRLSDDMAAFASDSDSYTPRLGRNSLTFSPRLGRDLAYGIYPDRVRFVRSAKPKST